jgi:hypothetical protein
MLFPFEFCLRQLACFHIHGVFFMFGYQTKRKLGASNLIDLFSCRGEKAFCSSECRQQQMLLEEGMDKFEPDDDYGICS